MRKETQSTYKGQRNSSDLHSRFVHLTRMLLLQGYVELRGRPGNEFETANKGQMDLTESLTKLVFDTGLNIGFPDPGDI